jgi:Ca-activated chloride channel family protein
MNASRTTCIVPLVLALGLSAPALAAGTLTPLGSHAAPVRIVDHHVDVVINNGFARTEVTQTFANPNDVDLEAVYSFPVPRSASLSEFTIYAGEKEINGEVLSAEEARKLYGQERDAGRDAGLAEKKSFYTFDFHVTPVRAKAETRIRFLYYQPVEIDTGVGRYLYPLEEGGTDDAALSFWTTNAAVDGTFSARVELKSAWPVAEVRTPGFEADGRSEQLGEGHFVWTAQRAQGARLDRDLVFYYKLAEGLPGRVEMLAYRADEKGAGTFMMILTPGLDLKPLAAGSDYIFVLDVSGSMQGGKIQALARGVGMAIGKLNAADRFRVVTFATGAAELTRGWVAATPEGVQSVLAGLETLRADGSTNLFDGIRLAMNQLDDDRVTSVVLVTDAVTNTGVVDPAKFHALMKQYDVRVFGFLMGNSANWPLMQTICDASGGFYGRVSTSDDLLGQIILAKGKITSECLHDAKLAIKGVRTLDTTGDVLGKVYRGQQLVLFGRYENAGSAQVTLQAALSGEDRAYTTAFDFPAVDLDHPEIERLWALALIDDTQTKASAGLTSPGESEQIITTLGVDYQIVTDYTSMVVASDQAFAERGIERRNDRRVAAERQAQAQRAARPIQPIRVDSAQPMFPSRPAPAVGGGGGGGGGGGALDPVSAAIAAALGGLALAAGRKRAART